MLSHETRTSSDGWCAANDQHFKTRLQGPIAKPQDGLGPDHMLGNPPQQMPLVKGLFRVRDAREIAPFQAKIRVFCCRSDLYIPYKSDKRSDLSTRTAHLSIAAPLNPA